MFFFIKDIIIFVRFLVFFFVFDIIFVFVRLFVFLMKKDVRKRKKMKINEKKRLKNIRRRIFYRLQTSADVKWNQKASADVVWQIGCQANNFFSFITISLKSLIFSIYLYIRYFSRKIIYHFIVKNFLISSKILILYILFLGKVFAS